MTERQRTREKIDTGRDNDRELERRRDTVSETESREAGRHRE